KQTSVPFANDCVRRPAFGSFVASSGARCTWRAASSASSWDCPRLHRQQTFPLQFFASQLTGTADRFRLLARSPLGRFFVMAADLHFAEDALTLHPLF